MNDLQVRGLTKAYGKHVAVNDVTFTVSRGTLACLIGPNGAGKSTTMRCLAGLQIADTGTVRVGQTMLDSLEAAKTHVAITPQELSLFDHLTAEESLRLVGDLRGAEPEALEKRITHWMEITELQAYRGRMAVEFSGGMKRKLAVAMAMISEPSVVVLDESFTGLDPESTVRLQRELRSYCERGGIVLLSSHILTMVAELADQLLIMSKGALVDDLSGTELSRRVDEAGSLTRLYLQATEKADVLTE